MISHYPELTHRSKCFHIVHWTLDRHKTNQTMVMTAFAEMRQRGSWHSLTQNMLSPPQSHKGLKAHFWLDPSLGQMMYTVCLEAILSWYWSACVSSRPDSWLMTHDKATSWLQMVLSNTGEVTGTRRENNMTVSVSQEHGDETNEMEEMGVEKPKHCFKIHIPSLPMVLRRLTDQKIRACSTAYCTIQDSRGLYTTSQVFILINHHALPHFQMYVCLN